VDTAPLQTALQHLRDFSLSDAELLGRFAGRRDEAAFAELVRRHGALVLGVCRRVLGDAHAAEDAFQATFLLLARRASRLTLPGSLAGWLHGAALRVANEARRAEGRRRRRERAHVPPAITNPNDLTWRDLRQCLDAELARLPEHLRAPLVLCYLQGLSQAEAAPRLGCTDTVLRGRLERGRAALRRLARLGLPLAAPLLLLPAPESASAAPCAATLATVTASLDGGPVVPEVSRLAAAASGLGGVSRWKAVAALALLAVAVGLGAVVIVRPAVVPPKVDDAPAEVPKPRTDLAGDPLPPDALMRLGTLRHRYVYNEFFWRNPLLPDGKTIVTYTPSAVRWVDMATGRLKDSCPLPKGQSLVRLSPDARFALLSDEKTFRVWDLATRKELRKLEGQGEPGQPCAMFSPDGRVVATQSDDTDRKNGLVRVWDVATGKELWHESVVMGFLDRGLTLIDFPPDGKTLAVFDNASGRVSLRDRTTGRETRSFAAMPRQDIFQPGLSPDGKTLFAGTRGATVRAWDMASGKELPPLDGHSGQGADFAVSRDGKTVLTTAGYQRVLVWDWPAGKERGQIEPESRGVVVHMAVSADGKRAEIICGGEFALRCFDLENGKEMPGPAEGHRSAISGFAITPDGKVVSCDYDAIHVWDLRTGRPLHQGATEHSVHPGRFAVSADGKLVATAGLRGSMVALRERDTGRLVRMIDAGGRGVDGIAFVPEGRLLAITAWTQARSGFQGGKWVGGRCFLTLWDADRGRELRRMEGEIAYGAPTFSPDGRLLAGTDREQVRVWDVATGRQRVELPQTQVHGLAFSPDSRTLACGDGDGITLWELATRKERTRIEFPSSSGVALSFSPDGRWLAWGGQARNHPGPQEVYLWDVWRGEKVRPFTGHDLWVSGLAFTPDGRRLVSAGADTTLLVWDMTAVAARQPP
jgi:RNA polymerase sigma factor (sigma-70 family)